MTNTHAQPSPLRGSQKLHKLSRIRLHPDPLRNHISTFQAWWVITRQADLYAWLAVQSVLQQAHYPAAQQLVRWANELRATGELPGGLQHVTPSRHAFTPTAINASQRANGAEPCGIHHEGLVQRVVEALEIDYRQRLNRQAKNAQAQRGIGEAADGDVPEPGVPHGYSPATVPFVSAPLITPAFPVAPLPAEPVPDRRERQRVAAAWVGSLPLGLVDGAVRRITGPLMRLPGLPDELPFGRVPEPLGMHSRPTVTLRDVRADGDLAVFLVCGQGSALRVPAEVFSLIQEVREAVLAAPVDGHFTDLAAQGAFGPDGTRLDRNPADPAVNCWQLEAHPATGAAEGSGDTPDEDPAVQRAREQRAIQEGVLVYEDAQWWLWLRFGGPVLALPVGSSGPLWGTMGLDLGETRWVTGWDEHGPLPLGTRPVPAPEHPAAPASGHPAFRNLPTTPIPGKRPRPRPAPLERRVPISARDLAPLMVQGEGIEELRAAFYRMEPLLRAVYFSGAAYGRIVIESLRSGPRGPWDVPQEQRKGKKKGQVPQTQKDGNPQQVGDDAEDRVLEQIVRRTFLDVVIDWWASDVWPGIGRRSVVWGPRRYSSRYCPACEMDRRRGRLVRYERSGLLENVHLRVGQPVPGQPGRTVEAWERWRQCDRCGALFERDEAAARNHYQHGVWLGKTLAHVWMDLPGDLQAHLRTHTPGAELNYRSGTANPCDELDYAASEPAGELRWNVLRPVVEKRRKGRGEASATSPGQWALSSEMLAQLGGVHLHQTLRDRGGAHLPQPGTEAGGGEPDVW